MEIYPYSLGKPILKNKYVIGNDIKLSVPTIIWYFLYSLLLALLYKDIVINSDKVCRL